MATDTATTTRAALGGRDFRLLWTGESISKAGSAVTTFALPLVAVRTLGAGPLMMGVLNAMIWVPWLLVGLQAGTWADRRSRRPLMIGCQVASALLIVSVPVVADLKLLTMWYVLVIAFAAGCSNVIFTAAYNAFVPLLVGKKDLLGANTRLMGSEQAANIAGPGLGGLITQVSSAVFGLFVDAASFLVCAACLWSIRAREPSDREKDRPRTSLSARHDGEQRVREPVPGRYPGADRRVPYPGRRAQSLGGQRRDDRDQRRRAVWCRCRA
jgi:MFS family permease